MKKNVKSTPEIINKKARHNYEILETIEAGIALIGSEVKSLRSGDAEVGDAHVIPRQGEMILLNFRIDPYQNAGAFNHEPLRSRKLLLKRSEIRKLIQKISEKGLSLIPLKVYFNPAGKVKVLLGLGRGKKLHDKREQSRKDQAEKDMRQALKNFNRR